MPGARFTATLLLAIGACLPGAAFADHDDDDRGYRERDHVHARREVGRGGMVGLERLLADAERRYPGRVIDVELDDDEYGIEILMRDGRVAELLYAARSGRLLEVEVDDD